ncbi:tRNA modification GTPase [Hyunsoonleella sp. SJ7]|uniref:tRNA modification GTPase n=2 Tax=Hyunsoonleella aquatilis TaxID=2762758 RepID=A0A923KIV0_9FLAO|nr:tRNA modification GTPase [Hyunsoonleella aquatilis]
MKIKLLFLLTTILSFNCYSQISFENGYFIDNNNQKTNCLIKNLDWGDNPTEFKYKLSENSELNEKTIKSVKEFGIFNASKYVRSAVKIDRSSNKVDELDNERKAKFQEEELFLKVLVEGKSTLYSYIDRGLIRYFYSIGTSNIEQLVFKSYITPEFKIGKNNRFRNQLWNNLKCSDIKKSRVEKIKYRKSDLVNFFVTYNSCSNQEYINFEEKQKKDLFNLNIRPRLNFSSLSNDRNINIKNDLGFGFGIEAELVLPFHKNKWSFIIEPTYQSFGEKSTDGGSGDVIVNYSSIELHAGLRHYFFLNDNSKIFINASLIYDSSLNDSQINSQEITDAYNMAFGLGYKYKDKYSIELRHQTRRGLGFDSNWVADYETLSIVFGYSLF